MGLFFFNVLRIAQSLAQYIFKVFFLSGIQVLQTCQIRNVCCFCLSFFLIFQLLPKFKFCFLILNVRFLHCHEQVLNKKYCPDSRSIRISIAFKILLYNPWMTLNPNAISLSYFVTQNVKDEIPEARLIICIFELRQEFG